MQLPRQIAITEFKIIEEVLKSTCANETVLNRTGGTERDALDAAWAMLEHGIITIDQNGFGIEYSQNRTKRRIAAKQNQGLIALRRRYDPTISPTPPNRET